jgi:hypothetical protein
MHPTTYDSLKDVPLHGLDALPASVPTAASAGDLGRRQRLGGAVAATATRLLPLVALLDAIQPQVTNESVFRTRRKKIRAHFDMVYAELQALTDLVREETRDISKDEIKQAAKEVALATLKNAPALINVAHQARLLA